MRYRQKILRLITLTGFVYCSFGSGFGFAYLPETGHQPLSTIAIRYFNECINLNPNWQLKAISASNASDIIQHNHNEDRAVSRMPIRLINWHFFNDDFQSRRLAVFNILDKSMTRLVRHIGNNLVKGSLSQEELNKQSGRMLHFMEDSTVPAHATPVWHGPGVSDSFDSIPVSNSVDALVKMEINTICDSADNSFNKYEIKGEKLKPQEAELLQLIADTSNQTLELIKKTACITSKGKAFSWDVFWTPPAKIDESLKIFGEDYFGEYGADAFPTNEAISIGEPLDQCTITEKKLREFIHTLHVNAVKADIRALYWINKQVFVKDD